MRLHHVNRPLQPLRDEQRESRGVLHDPVGGVRLVRELEPDAVVVRADPIRTRTSGLKRRAAASARDKYSTAQSVKASTRRV